MKTKSSRLIRFYCLLFLTLWPVSPPAFAQPPCSLGLRFTASQPTVSLTGALGSFYSIQYATGLSPTNVWVDRTLLQAQGPTNFWTDPAASAPDQQFYRAVSVPAPADTNLVFIQPGTFTMGSPTNEAERGSEETQHRVTISRGIWMGKYLVTQRDYLAVVGNNPSYFVPANGFSDDLTRPVERVSWNDATNYCAMRTQQERAAGLIPTNYVYRLPTESEWEYADRAGSTTAFYLGKSLHSGQANFYGLMEYDAVVGTTSNPNGVYIRMTTPVGNYGANPWGLYDMIGNVSEWCQDCYGPYPAGSVTDPQGGLTGTGRVLRGGSWGLWSGFAKSCRSAYRDYNDPTARFSGGGFRVVLAQGQ